MIVFRAALSCHGPSRHPTVIWKCLFSPIGNHASWNIILVSQKMLTHAPNLSGWISFPGRLKVHWRQQRYCGRSIWPTSRRRRRHFRGNGLWSRRRHARTEIKGGDENFLRSWRRSTAASRDVYSCFNHTLGLRGGSAASLEDVSALYHVATYRKWGCQAAAPQEVWMLGRAGMRCVCLALPAIIPSRWRWCKMSARE